MSAEPLLPGWQRHSLGPSSLDAFSPVSPPKFVLLDLHPVGLELASSNPVLSAELSRRGLACVAPYGARSWWTDRICTEFSSTLSAEEFLLTQVVPWIRQAWNVAPPAIAVTGISMGGQGALRLGFRQPKLFPVVAGIASALDFHEWYGLGTPLDDMYDSAEQARHDTAILQVNPHDYPEAIWFACDPTDTTWYRGNDRLHEKLSAIGIPHVADLDTVAGGHTWDYFNAMLPKMLDFVTASLNKCQFRLI